MANILCIETSGTMCSVAVFNDSGKCLGYKNEEATFQHAAVTTVLIDKLVQQLELDLKKIDAVGLSAGPGSYTGLRIGTSVAKGLCYALGIPLIAISSLEILASGFIENTKIGATDLICPAIDARRMEIYTAMYDVQLNTVYNPKPVIVTPEVFNEQLLDTTIHIIGTGAKKTHEVIDHSSLSFDNGEYLSARNMGKLVMAKWESKDFVDTAYFEPEYLKAFHTTAKIK